MAEDSVMAPQIKVSTPIACKLSSRRVHRPMLCPGHCPVGIGANRLSTTFRSSTRITHNMRAASKTGDILLPQAVRAALFTVSNPPCLRLKISSFSDRLMEAENTSGTNGECEWFLPLSLSAQYPCKECALPPGTPLGLVALSLNLSN